jgi:hypothetical protein
MGTSRGSSQSRLVVDDTVWASEAVGEEAVLAEFADETALSQPPPAPSMALELVEPPNRGLRLFSPRTPIKEVVRTVLVGCLSAMALGASFAIGFGYVWADRAALVPAVDTALTREGSRSDAATKVSSAPAAPASSSPSAAPNASQRPATPAPLERPSAATVTRPDGADPGPAFGVPIQRAAPPDTSRAGDRAPARASTDEPIPASKPMLFSESAVVAEPVAPLRSSTRPAEPPALPVVTPSPARSGETSESAAAAMHRADLDAVRAAIERYQTAYSQKDIGAMALVWPSVDVAGVARAFENVDR